MSALNRKLIRDLVHMRGQMIAVTAVLACGIATYVTMRSAYQALVTAQSQYYSTYRFADVFAHVKRAPESVSTAISAISGVAVGPRRAWSWTSPWTFPDFQNPPRDGWSRFLGGAHPC